MVLPEPGSPRTTCRAPGTTAGKLFLLADVLLAQPLAFLGRHFSVLVTFAFDGLALVGWQAQVFARTLPEAGLLAVVKRGPLAPVFLKTRRRIEAVMFLYFVALMMISLMERNIRNNMAAENIEKLPILPQGMNAKRPTWNNIRYFFRNVHLALIIQGEKILQIAVKGITALHDQLMRLLEVPGKVFDQLRDGWWQFADS